ncbi:hypothetical protein M9Y10_008920 [Tritrichomonas musculus]|uniref:Uncharacterized protein n=1 Tax=Tritrichomonas musculus TaxID=1915356 RepID=A0ABR2J085_9EUKA
MKVCICIRKISFDEKTAVLKPVNISVGTLPRLLTRSFPTKIKNSSLITCQGLWTCHPEQGSDDKFLISLVRDNKILASVVIPLSWLPQNQVVETWFPMKLQNHKTWKHAPMALITLHVDTLGNKRFDAPKGNLTITPAWKIPQKKNQKQSQQNYQPQLVQQQMPQMLISSPQPIAQPMFCNQYSQFPPQYVQNPQFINYQIPPQQPYQMQPTKGIQNTTSCNIPQQYAFINDADVPKVNYPIIH